MAIKRILLTALLFLGLIPATTHAASSVLYPSIDGHIGCGTGCGFGTWSTLHDATSASVVDDTSTLIFSAAGHTSAYILYRDFFTFDRSAIPSTATINSASLCLTQNDNSGSDGGRNFVVTPASNASPTALVSTDFDNITNTALSASTAGTNWTDGVRHCFSLNSTGLSYITSNTGYVKLSVRDYDFDFLNVAPTDYFWREFRASEYSGTTDDPTLEIDYTPASSSSSSAASSSSAHSSPSFSGSLILYHSACYAYESGSGYTTCSAWDTSVELPAIFAIRSQLAYIIFSTVVLAFRWLLICLLLYFPARWVYRVFTRYRPKRK